jgi:rsbT co-antagonist protein RsbR
LEEGAQGSEIERLKAQVAALQKELDQRDRTESALRTELADLRAILEQLPVAVYAVDREGKPIFLNQESVRISTAGARSARSPKARLVTPEEGSESGLFLPDTVTPYPPAELPLSRALAGDVVHGTDVFLRNAEVPQGTWLEAHATPLLDPEGKQRGALAVFVDSQSRKSLEDAVALRNKELVASESEKTELIARLRMAVQELSTPILELWEDVLALPVIGVVDSRRSAEMMERLLDEIVRSQSRFVIIDLTGVEVIDTSTADHFMKLVKAVGLIGARCVLTGIRPAVAQTLVDLDVNFGQLETLRNLKHGLRYCLRWLDAEDAAQTR